MLLVFSFFSVGFKYCSAIFTGSPIHLFFAKRKTLLLMLSTYFAVVNEIILIYHRLAFASLSGLEKADLLS